MDLAHNGKTENFADILPRVVKSMHSEEKFWFYNMLFKWEEIVGNVVASHINPVILEKGRLKINSDSPQWSQEILYNSRVLVDKINSFFSKEIVKTIEIIPPNIFKTEKIKKIYKKNKEEETYEVKLDERDVKIAEKLCESIKEDGVRKAAERAAARSLSRMRADGKKCEKCGRVTINGRYCGKCEAEIRNEKRRGIRALIENSPWLHYSDVRNIMQVPVWLVVSERVKIIQELAGKVIKGDNESGNVRKLVMMSQSVRPEEVNEELIKKVLDRLKFDIAACKR